MLFQAGGAEATVTGAVRSMRTVDVVVVVELPALSATVAVAARLEPSPVMVLFPGHVEPFTKPDSASVHVQLIETFELYQPFALAAVVGKPVSVGAVRSTLMALTVVDAVLPAGSTAVPVTDWFAPWVETVAFGPHEVTAFRSEHVKLTATEVLFQPFAFATGTRVALMSGAVLSSVKEALSATVVPLLHVELPL
ncbi:MAG TPA: hypothetical protein VIK05_12005 [Ilumatobacteraceae bacterium]